MRLILIASALMMLLAGTGRAESWSHDDEDLPNRMVEPVATVTDAEMGQGRTIQCCEASPRKLPPVREPAPLFTVPRALRLYGMFVFVVGLLLTQALVAPWLLGARARKKQK